MTKRLLAATVASLVINLACVSFVGAQQQRSKEEQRVSKIKKLLADQNRYAPEDPVTIKLNDGVRIKGYIAGVYDNHFVVNDLKSGQPTSVDYPQVKDMKSAFIGRKPEPVVVQVIGGVLAMPVLMLKCVITKRCVS
jgi:hypothetical protein